jgi:hypothetical protein
VYLIQDETSLTPMTIAREALLAANCLLMATRLEQLSNQALCALTD